MDLNTEPFIIIVNKTYIYIQDSMFTKASWSTGADWTVGKSVIYRIKFTKKKYKNLKKKNEKKEEKERNKKKK